METFNGTTPNGGIKTEVIYTNSTGNEVDKKVATDVVIYEIDKKGIVVMKTFGKIN